MKKNVIAVLPAYNVEQFIGTVVREVRRFASRILVVDDGSTDQTAKRAAQAGAEIITHAKNRGLGCALRNGIKAALKLDFDFLITLDSDGQHDPNSIKDLLKKFETTDPDVVIGSRFINKRQRKKFPVHRWWGNKILTRLTNLAAGRKIASDSQSGYRAFKKAALAKMRLKAKGMEISSEFILETARLKLNLSEVSIRATYAKEHSNQRLVPDTLRIVSMILKKRLIQR